VEKIAQAQIDNEKNTILSNEELLSKNVYGFFSNNRLESEAKRNAELVSNAEKVKNDAQSGEILNQIDIPEDENEVSFEMPPGGDLLKNLKNSDPKKYNELKKSGGPWFIIKQLFEDINATISR
jgi:hypothetical protein